MRLQQDHPDAYVLTIPAMGSQIDVRWIVGDGSTSKSSQDIGQILQTDIDRWVEVMSDYQQDSQVNTLCRQADDGNWHTCSAELWQVLMLCDQWNRWSEGAFDASIGALTRLRRSKTIATQQQWDQALYSSGWGHIEWDPGGKKIRFERPGLRLDFGAIGKGFVVDRLGERLLELGIHRYCINASGNMVFGQVPTPQSQGWPVSIGMLDHSDRSLRQMRLTECGIATSGDLHQKYRDRPGAQAGDKPTSHIVDPAKQQGLTNTVMSTVLASDATSADALATACCVHSERGTLRSWLSRLESKSDGCRGSFEVWVQSLQAVQESPVLIHWARET